MSGNILEYTGQFSITGNGLDTLKQIEGLAKKTKLHFSAFGKQFSQANTDGLKSQLVMQKIEDQQQRAVERREKLERNAIKEKERLVARAAKEKEKLDKAEARRRKQLEAQEKQALKRRINAIKKLQKEVLKTGLVVAGFVYGVDRFITSTANSAFEVDALSKSAGMAAENFQLLAMQYSNVASISTEKAQHEISALGERINKVKLGMADGMEFLTAGISIHGGSTAATVITQLQRQYAGLDSQRLAALLKTVGLNKEMAYLIKGNREELEKIASIPVMSKQQIAEIQQLGKSYDLIKKQLIAYKNAAMAGIAPRLTQDMERFFKILADNKDGIIKFIQTIVKFGVSLTEVISRSAMLIGEIGASIFKTDSALTGFAVTIGALMLAFSPMLALFSAIALILEDIWGWKNGGISAFGDVYQVISDIVKSVEKLTGMKFDSLIAQGALWLSGILAVNVALKGTFGLLKGLGLIKAVPNIVKKGFVGQVVKGVAKRAIPAALGVGRIPLVGQALTIGAGLYGAYEGYQYYKGTQSDEDNNSSHVANISNPNREGFRSFTPFPSHFMGTNKHNSEKMSKPSGFTFNIDNMNVVVDNEQTQKEIAEKIFGEAINMTGIQQYSQDFMFE